MAEQTTTARMARAETRLAEIRTEQQRQMQFAGERLGVFARLRELEREERRLISRIDRMRDQDSNG